MASNFKNFKNWYADTLNKLYPDRNSGFAILMITFPLLERYLRHKNKLSHKDNLNDRCMDELRFMFPVLSTTEVAWKFWNIFRNGILHQVTLSRENKKGKKMPEGWVSHDINAAVIIESDGSFLIHPVLFAKHIVGKIESDFAIFEKGSAVSTKLPKVKPHPTATNVGQGTQTIILGTNTEQQRTLTTAWTADREIEAIFNFKECIKKHFIYGGPVRFPVRSRRTL
jgi:hypothetical protein